MRLRELREARNENQQKLAILLNVSQTMISRYELGQATPDVPMLITLSKHYNVSIDYLLENTDVKSPFISSDLSEAETEMLKSYCIYSGLITGIASKLPIKGAFVISHALSAGFPRLSLHH
ncbi:helix-turn-helix transcriptional regulator [uncultured Ruminococcus sp.]|uniref:helix-turn-helix domain-containing protein n=1 Tax=uncultured Ruminococcus sp. TaxID=165186 RepID=UPI002600DFB6|nr:helix-turn-helix transcriptional regulator [uncultured Ruminococcus sp.]